MRGKRIAIRLATVGVTVLVGLILAFQTSAQAYLYLYGWGRAIGRATFDGTTLDPSFMTAGNGNVNCVVAGSVYIFFCQYARVERANINGGAIVPNLVTVPQPPFDTATGIQRSEGPESLAADAAHVYWHTYRHIGRAKLNGASVEPDLVTTEELIDGVAVDARHIYWTTGRGIGRSSLTGGQVEPDFLPLTRSAEGGGFSIAVQGDYIYWAATGGHSVGRARIDGTNANPNFIDGLDYVSSLALGGGFIYWEAEETFERAGRRWIGRANVSGADVRRRLFEVPRRLVGAIAADGLGPGAAPPPKQYPRRRASGTRT